MKNAIILILSLIIIGMGTFIIFDKVVNKNSENNNQSNQEVKTGDTNDYNNGIVTETEESEENEENNNIENTKYEVKLVRSNETIDFDKLKLNFIGYKDLTYDYYNYTLYIYFDRKEVENSIFNDTNNLVISSKLTPSFFIYKVGEVYILYSFNGHQCVGYYVLILNSNGEIIKSFSNVGFSLNKDIISISESSFGGCCPMGDNDCLKNNIKEYKYKIVNSKLEEIIN